MSDVDDFDQSPSQTQGASAPEPEQPRSATSEQDAWQNSQPRAQQPQQEDLPWAKRPAGQPSTDPLFGKNHPSNIPPYVRQRAPHKTQAAINDLSEDGNISASGYAHDSNITVRGGALSGSRTYRRARNDRSGFTGGQYGQYLEVPKGRRTIFESRERAKKRRATIGLLVIILALTLVVLLIAKMLGN